jgi:hypothetical protein
MVVLYALIIFTKRGPTCDHWDVKEKGGPNPDLNRLIQTLKYIKEGKRGDHKLP